ncbi:hypothetical protein V1509DRAFT_624221 [Lipomyces kononenkoae]
MELPERNDKTALMTVVSKSYDSISSGPPTPRMRGPLPSEGGYASFLSLDSSKESRLVPLHEITRWDMHFKGPYYDNLLFEVDACDGSDFGTNERNYLAWLRLAASFVSTSFAFITQFYLPPGRSILGPDRIVIEEPSLQNKGALAWGLVFLLCALFSIINAFFSYADHMHHIGRRVLMVQFSTQTLVFFGLSCVAMFAAGCYMMAGELIQARRSSSSFI